MLCGAKWVKCNTWTAATIPKFRFDVTNNTYAIRYTEVLFYQTSDMTWILFSYIDFKLVTHFEKVDNFAAHVRSKAKIADGKKMKSFFGCNENPMKQLRELFLNLKEFFLIFLLSNQSSECMSLVKWNF